mmetsp:Transcript_124025/g.356059  ORF Transcript_124025/g.356059 Transcript_124025/m.356059 type:complete len:263 (-) Transcript_124025:532-1320(-)
MNSLQLAVFEPSWSSSRHAFSGLPNCWMRSCANSLHASASGGVYSHSGAVHKSSHSKSDSDTMPQPLRSSAATSAGPAPCSLEPGHSRFLMARMKVAAGKLLREAQFAGGLAAAFSWSQLPAHDPNRSLAQRQKRAREAAAVGEISSMRRMPSSSWSRTFHNKLVPMSMLALRQNFRKSPRWRRKVAFGSRPRLQARTPFPYFFTMYSLKAATTSCLRCTSCFFHFTRFSMTTSGKRSKDGACQPRGANRWPCGSSNFFISK